MSFPAANNITPVTIGGNQGTANNTSSVSVGGNQRTTLPGPVLGLATGFGITSSRTVALGTAAGLGTAGLVTLGIAPAAFTFLDFTSRNAPTNRPSFANTLGTISPLNRGFITPVTGPNLPNPTFNIVGANSRLAFIPTPPPTPSLPGFPQGGPPVVPGIVQTTSQPNQGSPTTSSPPDTIRKTPLPQPSSTQPRANLGAPNFIGQIPFFLNAVLSTPAGALPKGPLWVVVFDFFPPVIKQAKNYEPQMPEAWEIERAFGTITSPRYQLEKGCILAQSVNIPGDALITNVEGLQYNGYIRGRVGLGRQDFDLLRITFLNTNVSFVDNVIRPWAVMTGHLGMIARPPETNYRTNITVYKLGIISRDQPPYVAQQFNFWGACAVSVDSEELNYTAEGTNIVKTGNFAYQWYTTSSDSNPFATGEPLRDSGVAVARAINPAAPVEVQRAIPVP